MTSDDLPPEWEHRIKEMEIKSEKDFREALQQYRLGVCPGNPLYWINGEVLKECWQENDVDFKRHTHGQLPIFMVTTDGSIEQINDFLSEHSLKHSESEMSRTFPGTLGRKVRPRDPRLDRVFGAANLALIWPGHWWFRRTDIVFFEKLHGIQNAMFPLLSLLWLTQDELETRWALGPFANDIKLADLIRHKGLVAYTLSLRDGVASNSGTTNEDEERDVCRLRPKYDLIPGFLGGAVGCLPSMFKLWDVHRFEVDNAKELFGFTDREIWERRVADYAMHWIHAHQKRGQVIQRQCAKMRLLRSGCRDHISKTRADTYGKILIKRIPDSVWNPTRGGKRNPYCPFKQSSCFSVFDHYRDSKDNPHQLECDLYQRSRNPQNELKPRKRHL